MRRPGRCVRRPGVAPRAGVRGCAAVAVDDPELALVSARVRVGQSRDRVLGGQAFTQEPQSVGAVARVRIRLGGDRADLRLGPGNQRADGEELRLRGYAPLSRLEVARDDRVRRDDPFSHR